MNYCHFLSFISDFQDCIRINYTHILVSVYVHKIKKVSFWIVDIGITN